MNKGKSMQKKLASLALSLVMVMSLFMGIGQMEVKAAVGTIFTDNGITYKVLTEDGTTGTVQVGDGTSTSYADVTNSATDIIIPTTVTNAGIEYTVTEIGQTAFYKLDVLKNITIPASVTKIGKKAFTQNNSARLETVNFEENSKLKTIDDRAFYEQTNFKINNFPSGVETVGDYSFYKCTALELSELPETLRSVGYMSFCQCTNVTFSKLPDNMTTIGGAAFFGCSKVTISTIPESVTTMGSQAFIHIGSQKLNLSESITEIESYVFQNCPNLESVKIPNGITKIKNSAFTGCSSLSSVICDNMTAPTLELAGEEIFGRALTGGTSGITLFVPGGATGYDAEGWPTDIVYMYEVFGKIIDNAGNPIAGATVTETTTNLTETTGSDGKYKFHMIATTGENVNFLVKATGAKDVSTSVTIANNNVEKNIKMNIGEGGTSGTGGTGTAYTYDVIDGANATVSQGSAYSIRVDGPFDEMINVQMDGKTVDSKYYTATKGSTIVTFTAEYMSTLATGKHTVVVNYNDGSYGKTEITVTEQTATVATQTAVSKAPKTGDSTSMVVLLVIALFSGTAVIYLNRRKKGI